MSGSIILLTGRKEQMARPTKEEQKRKRQNRFSTESHRRTTKTVSFGFHKVYDLDIIQQLDKQENRTAYVKNLIREDIKKQQENQIV